MLLSKLLHLRFPVTSYRARLLPSRLRILNTFADKYGRGRSIVFSVEKFFILLEKHKLMLENKKL